MAQSELTKAIRKTVRQGGAEAFGDALHELSFEELDELKLEIEVAQMNATKDRDKETSERREALRDMARTGEALVWENVNCGNCSKCGYRKHGTQDATIRPHGPYAFLWSWGTGGRISKTYLYQNEEKIEAAKARIKAKKDKSDRAREELKRTRRGMPDKEIIAKIDRIEIPMIPGVLTKDKSEWAQGEVDKIEEAKRQRESAKQEAAQSGSAEQESGEAVPTG